MNDLVCLHAAASSPATWDPLRPGLAALGYRVHCPVLLGHRGSERRPGYPLTAFRDDVLRQLEGLGRITLVGHSLGAYVASMVAAADPGRIAGLVLEELPVPPRHDHDAPAARKQAGGIALRAFALVNRVDPVMMRDVIAELRRPQSHLDQPRYELVAQAVPGAATVTVDAGHRIHTKAPARWMDAVSGFLTGG